MEKSNLHEQTILKVGEKIGKAIILREHEHFCEDSIDNNEHIPRVRRIVDTIDHELCQLGISREKARCLSEKIKEYGKELFMKTWVEYLEDSSYEFDSIYKA